MSDTDAVVNRENYKTDEIDASASIPHHTRIRENGGINDSSLDSKVKT